MDKYLGIDYGLERTGLAISGPFSDLVFPLKTLGLKVCGNRKKLFNELVRIAASEEVTALVLGLPLHGDGSESEMSVIVRNAGVRIRKRTGLPIYLMPEYLSSMEARKTLEAAGLKSGKIKSVIDAQAACNILSSFLAQDVALRICL